MDIGCERCEKEEELLSMKRKKTDEFHDDDAMVLFEAVGEDYDRAAHNLMNKSQHHFFIAAWLVATFGQEFLRSRGGYVVDVAGGLGKLDFELSVRYGVPSILIDPKFSVPVTSEESDQLKQQHEVHEAPMKVNDSDQFEVVNRDRVSTLKLSSMMRRKMKKITRCRAASISKSSAAQMDKSPLMASLQDAEIHVVDDGTILPEVERSIRESSLLPFDHIPKYFPLFQHDIDSDQELLGIISRASFIIGIHPDQVTDAIVDIAITMAIPFVIVPCCVFTKQFPNRKTPQGEKVRSYEELVTYLKAKHKNIIQETLPFHGRNVALYCTNFD